MRLGPGSTAELPDDVDLVVTSPGWSPTAPLLAQAADRGVPIWGEVELAWRLRDPEHAAPWLAVTGTNGKTTTVQMLEAMLRAGGLRTVACGNVGLPIVEAVMDPEPWDVLAVELSSFQLHWTSSMKAESAAVLNVAEDHLDWYAGPSAMSDYAADKGRIYTGVERACVYNLADPVTEQLVRDADVQEGARAIGFTLGTPGVGMLGVVDDVLADRAFVEDRQTSAAELCTLGRPRQPGPALRLQRTRGRRARPLPRRLDRGDPAGPARVPSRRAPDRRGRGHRRRHLDRRLQGDQPPCGAGLAARLRPGGVGGRRAGQGGGLRRPRRGGARPVAGRRTPRPGRPGDP